MGRTGWPASSWRSTLSPDCVTTAQKRPKLYSESVKEQEERKLNQAQDGASAIHPVLILSRMLPCDRIRHRLYRPW